MTTLRKSFSFDGFLKKSKPIWMILNTNQIFPFTISYTGNRANSCLGWFLNKDNIKFKLCFENCIHNQIVFLDILRKYFYIFDNHALMLSTDEWIDCFQFSQIFAYSLKYHSLLNLCHQNGYSFELAWWLPLQFEHLNKCRHSSLFLVFNLRELVFLLAL